MRVLITGVANGIGAAAARRLEAEGAEIVGVDVADGDWHQLDLSDMAAIDVFAPEGTFDALINAAGLPPRAGQENAVLTVNFQGLRRFTERLIPSLNPGGSIVSLASKAGSKWQENIDQVKRFLALGPEDVAELVERERIDAVRSYDLSKEALIVWTKTQTARLAKANLRANTVSPAAVDTRILQDFKLAFGDRASRGIALTGRPGTAEEIAAAIAFLASPQSGWIRSTNLVIDGGLDARLDCANFAIAEAE